MSALIQAGLQPVPATAIGAAVGSVANYLGQFHWTFDGRGAHGTALPAYACTVVLGWAANGGLFYALVSMAHIGLASAQLFTTLTIAVMNFVMYKRIVFHERMD